jgi:lactoylglutathione lyase
MLSSVAKGGSESSNAGAEQGQTPVSESSLVNDLTFRIHHTMLPVADLRRSVAFYTRLFGMDVMGRRSDENRRVEVCHVGYGDRATQPSIELIQDVSEHAPAQVQPTGGHISIHVSDLAKLCAILTDAGVEFKQPLMGRQGSTSLRAWVRDPDGHDIELGERPPAS